MMEKLMRYKIIIENKHIPFSKWLYMKKVNFFILAYYTNLVDALYNNGKKVDWYIEYKDVKK